MGKKSEELIRRLQEGLPNTDALDLIREVEEENAREQAPKVNPFKFRNTREQRLSDLWFSKRAPVAVEQKNKIGLAYISKVLGLGDDIARGFAQGDMNAFHQVGMRQGGAENYTPNFAGFWKEVQEVFPGMHTEEDTAFLSEQDISSTWHFLWQLEVPLAEESPILRAISTNAHAYK